MPVNDEASSYDEAFLKWIKMNVCCILRQSNVWLHYIGVILILVRMRVSTNPETFFVSLIGTIFRSRGYDWIYDSSHALQPHSLPSYEYKAIYSYQSSVENI